MTESKQTISWEKEGHIFCDFRFSSSFQKIDMILLTRPEGCLIGRIILGIYFHFQQQEGSVTPVTMGATQVCCITIICHYCTPPFISPYFTLPFHFFSVEASRRMDHGRGCNRRSIHRHELRAVRACDSRQCGQWRISDVSRGG